MLADKNLSRLNCYKFMIALGISGMAQLVPHTATGFFTIFQRSWSAGLNKVTHFV